MASELVTLTDEQQAALRWLVERSLAGERLLALRGFAGTGKTSLIPHLLEALMLAGKQVMLGTPTHRAAMVLKKKGMSLADTIHSLCMIPYFKMPYASAMAWLGEAVGWKGCEEHPLWQYPPKDDNDPILQERCNWLMQQCWNEELALPELVWEYAEPDVEKARALPEAKRSAGRRLGTLGIHGRAFFEDWGVRHQGGVLIIDEGSMVGAKMLGLCQDAFSQVIMVGDPGQLPPVKDTPVLETLPGVTLEQVHRQAADSPMLQLATRARIGEKFYLEALNHLAPDGTGVVEILSLDPRNLLTRPIMVWRNEVRRDIIDKCRKALWPDPDKLYVGEPIVVASSTPEDKSQGYYHQAAFTIAEVFEDDPRLVCLMDADGKVSDDPVRLHMEDNDVSGVPSDALLCRFGYAITVHGAQGSEWDTVYISKPEVRAYAASCLRYRKWDDFRKWSYTAITRAKQRLYFLLDHNFTTGEEATMATGPITAPMTPIPADPFDVRKEPDDIPDPQIPLAAQGPGAAVDPVVVTPPKPPSGQVVQTLDVIQALQVLQDRGNQILEQFSTQAKGTLNVIDNTCVLMARLAEALKGERAGDLPIEQGEAPYRLDISATSPEGFPVIISLKKYAAEDFAKTIANGTGITAWLASQGYTKGLGR